MDDIRDELEDLRAAREDLVIEAEEAGGRAKKALEFAISQLDTQIKVIEDELVEVARLEQARRISESPEGRLLWAVANAMQYDYLADEDIESVLAKTKQKLASQGLHLQVLPLQESANVQPTEDE